MNSIHSHFPSITTETSYFSIKPNIFTKTKWDPRPRIRQINSSSVLKSAVEEITPKTFPIHLQLQKKWPQNEEKSTKNDAKITKNDEKIDGTEENPQRSVYTWTKMISESKKHGNVEEALQMFIEMRSRGVSPNEITLTTLIPILGLDQGKQIHTIIIKSGYLQDHYLKTAIFYMYAKFGAVEDARQVFDEMPVPHVAVWTAMISAYVRHGMLETALEVFKNGADLRPNEVTLTALLPLCNLDDARQVHAFAIKAGFHDDVFLGSALVDLYAKEDEIHDAHLLFRCIRQGRGRGIPWT